MCDMKSKFAVFRTLHCKRFWMKMMSCKSAKLRTKNSLIC